VSPCDCVRAYASRTQTPNKTNTSTNTELTTQSRKIEIFFKEHYWSSG